MAPRVSGWPARLARFLPERGLARDGSILFSGFSVQLVTQMGWLLLALMFLGPDGYGLFVGLTAVTIAASYLAGPGCEQLLIRRTAGDRAAMPPAFAAGLISILLTGVPLGALFLWLLPAIGLASIGPFALAAILVADLLLGRVANLCSAVYLATGQATRQSLAMVAMSATRLLAIALAGLMPGALTLEAWAFWYFGSALLGAAICLALVVRDHGAPRLPAWPREWRDGAAFAAEAALQAAAMDLDKPIVLALAGPVAAGYYAAAARIIGTLLLPMRALGYAVYGRLFKLGEQDRASSMSYALRVLPVSVGLGLGAVLGVLLFADLVPLVLGPAYAGLPVLLRLFCLFPLAQAVFALGADVLSATRLQPVRLYLVGASLAATLALCWWVTPWAGAEGAAVVRVGVTLLAAGAAWMLVWRLLGDRAREERA
jgi:O-antigen/teichoic acid export membrane protein